MNNRIEISNDTRSMGQPMVEVMIMQPPGFDGALTAYLEPDAARLYGLQMIREADLAEVEYERIRQEENE